MKNSEKKLKMNSDTLDMTFVELQSLASLATLLKNVNFSSFFSFCTRHSLGRDSNVNIF